MGTIDAQLAEVKHLIDNGEFVYKACEKVGLPLQKWYTLNKKSFWREAGGPKPEGMVLVIYLGAFFGKLDPRMTIAYYDDPADYQQPDQGEGWKDWLTEKKLLVTHWTPLPDLPVELENFSMDQTELLKKIPSIKTGSFLGTIDLKGLTHGS